MCRICLKLVVLCLSQEKGVLKLHGDHLRFALIFALPRILDSELQNYIEYFNHFRDGTKTPSSGKTSPISCRGNKGDADTEYVWRTCRSRTCLGWCRLCGRFYSVRYSTLRTRDTSAPEPCNVHGVSTPIAPFPSQLPDLQALSAP